MENEIWKKIKDYPNYQVSNLGNVKSLNYNGTKIERTLKPSLDINGYLRINLYNNCKMKYFKIHQLVAIVFLNHIPDGRNLVVNHINFVKTDNRLENLEIVTMRENSNKKHLKSSSQYVGVSKHLNKWRAIIKIKQKNTHLGLFETEIEASNAYQKALHNL